MLAVARLLGHCVTVVLLWRFRHHSAGRAVFRQLCSSRSDESLVGIIVPENQKNKKTKRNVSLSLAHRS